MPHIRIESDVGTHHTYIYMAIVRFVPPPPPPLLGGSSMGNKDHPPYFEGRELKKKCFGRYSDGNGWVLGATKGLEGLKQVMTSLMIRSYPNW